MIIKPKIEIHENKQWLQILAATFGALTTFTTGQWMGWSSPSIPPLLNDKNNTIIEGGLTTDQGSWVASLVMCGNIVAVPLVALTVDIFGRRKTVLISSAPVFMSWLIIAFAYRVEHLYVARFLAGVGETYGKISMFMYIGEIAEAHIRGALGTILAVTINLGILYEYAIGPFVSFRNLALISAPVPLLQFILFFFVPESPYFLVLRGRLDEAKHALQRLRRNTNIIEEFETIKDTVDKRLTTAESFRQLFMIKKNRNTLFLMCTLFTAQELSGITPNIMYATTILQSTNEVSTISKLMPSTIPLLKTVATFITMFLVDRSGRRPLFILSSIGCAAAMTCLSVYYYYQEMTSVDISQFHWVPLFSMLSFNMLFIFGLGCLPFIMIGELFSTDIKALAVCFTAVCGPLSGVIATKLFQLLADSFGEYSSFAFFASTCFASLIFVIFFLPETKNKSLAEIQNELKDKEKNGQA